MKKAWLATILRKIDIFLSDFNRFFITSFFLSILYYFLLFPQTKTVLNEYVPTSVFFALYTLWCYRSSRKYGLVDTMIFSIFVPFFVINALLPLFSSNKTEKPIVKADFSPLLDSFADALTTAVNEVFSGKVIEKEAKDDGAYITLEVPYGIHIPKQELIKTVAPDIHVLESRITHLDITDRRIQFIVTPEGLKEYMEYKKSCMPWDTFSEIFDRVALRTKIVPVSRKKQ